MFIVMSGLAKLIFHQSKFISSRVPESCLLIVVGAISGVVINIVDGGRSQSDLSECVTAPLFPRFTPELFFYLLLPPIILESSYSLHNRVFMENLGTILIFAVLGTIVNFLLIGGGLVFLFQFGLMGNSTIYKSDFALGYHRETVKPGHLKADPETFSSLTPIQLLLFSSLISAVDPVAVLAVFSEVGVNPDLYFLVFGESLLNDAVAVVLYNMMNAFTGMEAEGVSVEIADIFLGIASFFTVALGGLIIGFIFGIITALITKATSEIRVLEPLAIFGLAYLSYLMADLVGWSGIISLIGCGMVQAHYSLKNISQQSRTTINYFTKMLSSTCEGIIFLYLGMALFGAHVWHTGFVLWTVGLTLIVRFISIFSLTFFVNLFRHGVKTINLEEQFLMSYGGLRGAVGFSLVLLIDNSTVLAAGIFVTATLTVIIFTVFLQGSTIKPLVNLLKIDKTNGKPTISEEINLKMFDHIMAGVEIISGKIGHFAIYERLHFIDERFLQKYLCVLPEPLDLAQSNKMLTDHILHLYGPAALAKKNLERKLLPPRTDLVERQVRRLTFRTVSQIIIWLVNYRRSMPQVDRHSLTSALSIDPMKRYYQVHDKNLINNSHRDIKQVAAKREEMSQRIRDRLLLENGDHPDLFNFMKDDIKKRPFSTRRASSGALIQPKPYASVSSRENLLNRSMSVDPIARHLKHRYSQRRLLEGVPWEDGRALDVLAEQSEKISRYSPSRFSPSRPGTSRSILSRPMSGSSRSSSSSGPERYFKQRIIDGRPKTADTCIIEDIHAGDV
ncbi:Na(+)/H(+) exchanger beta [Eurytemora carolleeae]|uniref:Na(+)/H(+) exchanger beta n=1 Tax=Eurytemora carolleeae TaxID=1294199 RepID=UPI000C75BCC7|nr:Na(+)/H(+) exchanger beta [Eurytemora carolleeae]|eukprot:XP_023338659.1 Na(+)/H(+) exchanger beta-like [Eurytemora affinis]